METLSQTPDGALSVESDEESMRIEPWGPDGIRVRSVPRTAPRAGSVAASSDSGLDTGLLPTPPPARPTDPPRLELRGNGASLTSGRLRLTVRPSELMTTAIGDAVHLSFSRTDTAAPLLAEEDPHPAWPRARRWRAAFGAGSSGLPRLEVSFRASGDERLFGLGQYQHGRLAQKPGVMELEQQNMRVSIPFLLSSRGYGFLWNNPAIGRVELLDDHTRWVAEATRDGG